MRVLLFFPVPTVVTLPILNFLSHVNEPEEPHFFPTDRAVHIDLL